MERIKVNKVYTIPNTQKLSLKKRTIRKAKISEEVYRLAERLGYKLFYSFTIMPNNVVAYKNGHFYGPVFKDESILELLVDEQILGK